MGFQEAGATCSTITYWREYAGSPFVQTSSGNCCGFGEHDGTAPSSSSTCNENEDSGHQPLCYCEVTSTDSVLGESSLKNPTSLQEAKLNQWTLPPNLDVQWPKGHSSLWELISSEVGNHVEEVGTSVLTALGANVVSTRPLAGTSERHFEFDVKWPNGGSHVLDEVKNHLEEVKKHHSGQIGDKVQQMEVKMDEVKNQIVDKVHKMETKVVKMESMIGKVDQMEDKVDKME